MYINAWSKVHQGIAGKEIFGNGKWDDNGMMIVEKWNDSSKYVVTMNIVSPPQLNRLHAPMQHSVGHGRENKMGYGEEIFQNIQFNI